MSEIQEITVKHAGGEYPVYVGAGAVEKMEIDESAAEAIATAVVSSEKISKALKEAGTYIDHFAYCNIIDIPDGEEYKTLETVNKIIDTFTRKMMPRDGTVIALGGGVVGDIAGFAAAVYMRGVRFVQIPTTLLAMVDAAVGGKTGVNHERGKNLIGAFHQPAAVYCDTEFLKTLPEREYRAGLAEVVKYGLLGDADFFAWLEKNADALMDYKTSGNSAVQEAIVRSVKMKAEIVAEDERETTGRRALLNLGHTFAHALENVAGYGKWLHGEAVAAGLVAAAKLSEKICGFAVADTARVIALLEKFNLPVSFGGVRVSDMLSAMFMDKKRVKGGTEGRIAGMRYVVMNCIGDARLHDLENLQTISAIRKVLGEMCEADDSAQEEKIRKAVDEVVKFFGNIKP